jgi:dUTPase
MSKYKVGNEMIETEDIGFKAEAKMMQETLRQVKEQERINNLLQIKYIDKTITPMKKIDGGDLVDLRVSRVFDCKYNYQTKKLEMAEKKFPYQYNQGDTLFFKLGFAMKMPPNKKANVYPRSGMFKNYGFLLTNSVGQIDNAFQGNTDEWGAMMCCTRDGEINYDDRILQFEVVNRTMENIKFEIVENLQGEDRGGYSSTGIK